MCQVFVWKTRAASCRKRVLVSRVCQSREWLTVEQTSRLWVLISSRRLLPLPAWRRSSWKSLTRCLIPMIRNRSSRMESWNLILLSRIRHCPHQYIWRWTPMTPCCYQRGQLGIISYHPSITVSERTRQRSSARVTAVSVKIVNAPLRNGVWVLVYHPQDETGGNRKLSRPWHGPYRVTSIQDLDVCLVKVYFPQDQEIQVHQSRVKACPVNFPSGFYWYKKASWTRSTTKVGDFPSWWTHNWLCLHWGCSSWGELTHSSPMMRETLRVQKSMVQTLILPTTTKLVWSGKARPKRKARPKWKARLKPTVRAQPQLPAPCKYPLCLRRTFKREGGM